MAKKSIETYYDRVYLKKLPDGRFCETRLSAHQRYKNTIEPLEKLLKYLEIDS